MHAHTHRLTPLLHHDRFTQEPTEQEKEEMDKIEEAAQGGGGSSAVDVDNDPAVAALVKKANKLEWQLTSKDGLKKAANDLLNLFQNHKGKHLDLPDDEGAARMKIGTAIAQNRDLSAGDMVKHLVKELGFVEAKAELAMKKETALESAVKEPQNAGIVAAFQELAELYYKEGNRNAGTTYTKVVKALRELPYVITEDNAQGLCKGKTKVANIGKSSADKIYEFVTTGTMAKLEEKRNDVR
jgi:Helix-hairpin-helix domain